MPKAESANLAMAKDVSYIHPSLRSLAVDIDLLDELPGNPRIGDVDAIAASLTQFGQVKPIVIRPKEDGRYVILAGNHTTHAARSLGWTHIAAVNGENMDESEAAAFALVDNRVADLAYTDEELIGPMIIDIAETYGELFDSVGWDEFEISAFYVNSSDEVESEVASGRAGGYVAPVVITQEETTSFTPTVSPVQIADASSETGTRLVAPDGTDARSTVLSGVGGSTSSAAGSTKKAQIQYTLVFDDASQMGRWWDFVRFLRSSPVYEGDTIAERLMAFVEAHGEF